ncbi:unnamed protein product [Musa acuminata subsp. malaccensis]|uniref:(wild Malaysian banana) hypothetical protein n=1 Tax=Musa acuminata subsp. malaccensis TaxID=214687 RepID=A0A804JCS0_MUSAM|nr:PREDICTED: uncharacterized protein LOC103988206 [Musa acuminata subsp. malaccensis]CAG1845319.1 unnamed protein product [Musa acuminata subsp. malaccensis]
MSRSYERLHLKCELTNIKLTKLNSPDFVGNLFIRCYVNAGGGRRIMIDSCDVPPTGDPTWDRMASVECSGSSRHVRDLLERHGIVFELRGRRSDRRQAAEAASCSELLGTAEVPWRDICGPTETSVHRHVSLVMAGGAHVGDTPPEVVVYMAVRVSKVGKVGKRMEWEEGCEWSVGEEDVFAAAAAAVVDDAF